MSGLPWSNATTASVSRKNKTSVISDTGDNLEGYDKTKFAIVVCTDDSVSEEFLQDHVYLFGVDEDVIDISNTADHTHEGAGTGGSIFYSFGKNHNVIDVHLFTIQTILKANWNQTTTGTATIEDGGGGATEPYIRLRPNGTSGSGATISYTGAKPRLDVGSAFVMSSVINFETASSLAAHIGVNADDVTAADSNTGKVQAEVCTSTSNNWYLRTANGSANSASDTGVSAMNTNNQSVMIGHDPFAGTPNSQLSIDSANSFTKTTNIQSSTLQHTIGNLVKFSVKNNTGADRPMRYRGCRLTYFTADSWGYSSIDFE